MILDLSSLSHTATYHLLTQTIIPRPIAWILSDNGDGSVNVAPFSFFNAVCANPAVLSVSVGKKSDGSLKDTWRNIEERSSFVVHIPSVCQAQSVVASSKELPFGESEVTLSNLDLVEQNGWCLPRISGTLLAFYCEKVAIHEIGRTPQGLILGEVTSVFLDDSIVDASSDRLMIDPIKLDPLARLGGTLYAPLGPLFSIDRP